MILDMGNSKDIPLILGHPFLNIVNACIFVGSGKIQMTLARKRETFPFVRGPSYATNLQVKRPAEKEARNSRKLGSDKKRAESKNPRSRKRGWHKKKEPSSTASCVTPDKEEALLKKEEEEDPLKEEPLKDELPGEEEFPWFYGMSYCLYI